MIHRRVVIGKANGQATQHLQIVPNAQLPAADLGIPGHADLDAGAEPALRQRQHERLQVHADAHGIPLLERAAHAHDGRDGRVEEVEVPQHRRAPGRHVVVGDG